MSRRGVEQETSSAGCLVTGIASVVLPVVLFLLLADFGGPWLGVAGVALFSGALAVFILSCLPKG